MKRRIYQMRRYAGLVAASLLVSVSVAARAEPTPADKAAAEALFEEGRKLVAAGEFEKACAKLEASQRLDGGVGTLLYLADAYEKGGHIASAWVTFREAAATAKAGKQQKREGIARARAAALEPKLAYLTIAIGPAEAAPGLVVKRNEVEVKSELWGTEVPIDPGSYVVEASAPGKKTWVARIDIPASPGAHAVTIPALEDAPAPKVAPAKSAPAIPAAEPRPQAKARNGTPQRVLGVVVGGAGLAAFGVAGAFTARALSKDAEADAHCDGTRCRDKEGAALSKSARSAADMASVMVGAGAAALAGGVILFVTAPSSKAPPEASPRLTPVVGPSAFGFVIGGRF